MQSLKVQGPAGSLDFETLLVLGPLQKLLLPFIFHGSVPLRLKLRQIVFTYSSLKSWFLNANAYFSTPKDYGYFFQKSN